MGIMVAILWLTGLLNLRTRSPWPPASRGGLTSPVGAARQRSFLLGASVGKDSRSEGWA